MTMTDAKRERLLAIHRAAERDAAFFAEHPELLEPYRGQWVVTYDCRVIAASPDGSEAARRAPAKDYPGSSIFYMPTLEELEGILVI